jgi:hypothetical protein
VSEKATVSIDRKKLMEEYLIQMYGKFFDQMTLRAGMTKDRDAGRNRSALLIV